MTASTNFCFSAAGEFRTSRLPLTQEHVFKSTGFSLHTINSRFSNPSLSRSMHFHLALGTYRGYHALHVARGIYLTHWASFKI